MSRHVNSHAHKAKVIADFSSTREATPQQQMSLQEAQIEATLAVAYELRTANLIALAQMEHRNSLTVGFHADYDSQAIHERLGMA